MISGMTTASGMALDDFVAAFETAQEGDGSTDLTHFLPAMPHPLYRAVASELIRVDLEFSWRRGQPKRMEDYQPLFPDLFQDQEVLQAIAFEEYRLRRQAGEVPCPTEYRQRFGVRVGL
jgi:hypothetical protein